MNGDEQLQWEARWRLPAAIAAFLAGADRLLPHLHPTLPATAAEGLRTRWSTTTLLILAIIDVESDFEEEAISDKGARGLMQIKPAMSGCIPSNTLRPSRSSLKPRYKKSRTKRPD